MQPIVREKSEYYARTSAQMDTHLAPPPWSLREKLALTCRILANEGHESAIAGQITARGDKPGTYWMLGFGLGFDEARRSNIVLVDDDLNLLEGEGMVNPSNRFHLWIYRHRPSVNAIVHTHPPHISALSMIGRPLVASHMDTSMFHDDCAYLPEWPGPPVGDEEGKIIHNALGDFQTERPEHNGLTDLGVDVIKACNRLGILVDLAHATNAAIDRALESSAVPMIWSHSAISATPYSWLRSSNLSRQIHIDYARKIAQRGGAVGLWSLRSTVGSSPTGYADALMRMVDMIGPEHVMFGTDLEGVGKNGTMDQLTDLRKVADLLLERGMDDKTLKGICFENYARCLRTAMEAKQM